MNRVTQRVVLIAVACVLLGGVVRASERSEDLTARRARAMERVGPDAMLVLWSSPSRLALAVLQRRSVQWEVAAGNVALRSGADPGGGRQ